MAQATAPSNVFEADGLVCCGIQVLSHATVFGNGRVSNDRQHHDRANDIAGWRRAAAALLVAMAALLDFIRQMPLMQEKEDRNANDAQGFASR